MKPLSLSLALILFLFSCTEKVADKKDVMDSVPAKKKKVQLVFPMPPKGDLEDLLDIKSQSELESKFGYDHISIDTIWGEQGAYVLGSFIDAHSKNEVQIMWKDYPECTAVKEVIIQNYKSTQIEEQNKNEWKSTTGVMLNMTVNDLEKINGKAFVFGGFDESVSSNVHSWNGGKINAKHIEIELSAAGKMNGLPYKEMHGLLLQTNISSRDETIQKIQPWVNKITIYQDNEN